MVTRMFLTLDKRYDETVHVKVFLSLDTELIRKGILSKLTSTQLIVLLAIASHMDDNGEAFPSMRYLAEITGVAVNTVKTAINGLLKLTIDGLPIITRNIEGTGARKRSKYNFVINTSLTPVATPITEDATTANPIAEPVRKSPKDFIDMFFSKYLLFYKIKYKVNGIRDISSIKSMMKLYSDEQMEAIMETVITEYPKRWSNVKFPAPTIGAMSSWLATQAVQINNNRTKPAEDKWANLDNGDEEDFVL
jgi:hypothetical protein